MRRNILRFIACLLFAPLLVGCVLAPDQRAQLISDPNDLLHDEFFIAAGEGLVIEAGPDLFELPENYRRELDRRMASVESEFQRYLELKRWIYRRFQDFDFDVMETSSLAELGTNRKINCLSFSVLFVAAARYVDVAADFQLVFAPPYWDKEGNNWVMNQHINVTGSLQRSYSDYNFNLGPDFSIPNEVIWQQLPQQRTHSGNFSLLRRDYHYTADINPSITGIAMRRQRISEQQVLSLYHSNKSMEFLLDKDIANAYAHTRQALLVDPDSAVAWNNLGVLYSRVDQVELSIAAYQRAILLDEKMNSAKSNLANQYRSQGEIDLAQELETQIAEYRNQNPYYHSALADSSMETGEYEQAISQLEEALSRKQNEHYFYHQLAMVNQQLGDMDAVIENLTRARRYARGSEKVRFSGKLKALEAVLAGNN